MISYIKRENLDVKKYDFCIKNALQSRVYAMSWYLDSVAQNWDVLVLNDYEAVMPLPWKQKYFIKYVSQPYFCQQLGVFSKEPLPSHVIKRFIKKIPKKFVKVTLNLNSDNIFYSKDLKKNNYVLELSETYQTLSSSFSKRRKRSLKIAKKHNLKIKKISVLELIKLKKDFYTHIIFSENVIKNLSKIVIRKGNGFILGVYKDEIFQGGAFFLKFNNRIIYLFSSYNKEARKTQASSFLINFIIRKYASSSFILDFEGSNIINIASFFKSFGAKNKRYTNLNKNRILTLFLS